ncbi:MAG: penicillin-binding protein 2 [Deltaproteobacteria bacterium]|nr:penicillin-binding protein 2 [Deltaproteobacteria bacterium]MBW2079483.1 penicillin-binding protein 2 [Deltaproteobacteria bacterium]
MKFKIKTIWHVKRFHQLDQEANKRRCDIAILIMFLCLVTFCARLWHLQIVQGEDFRQQSERNRIRSVRLQPPRGKILDRTGRLLAGVKPCFNVCLVKEDVRDMEALLAKLSPLLGETEAEIRTRLGSEQKGPKYVPIVIKRGAEWETLSRIESRLFSLPGVFIEVTPIREYPYGSIAPHLLGYLGEISRKDIEEKRYKGARSGDLVGKYGIEERFENDLAGVKGQRRLEVDAEGRLVRVIDEKPPIPGKDLYLSIDLELQQASEEAMKEYVGALVALDPQTGRILALVSSPAFDPDAFATGIDNKEWEALNDPVSRPLQNKALQGRYAPASTLKIVVAAAALQEGIVTRNTSFECASRFRLGKSSFRCWDWRGHGQTNLYKALVESCDIYFYQVGLKLKNEKIVKYANAFGLGSKTGIDLPNESPGFIATPDWKLKKYNEPWQEGETLITAIGQGFTLVTPLQMACLTSAVANGGTLYSPVYLEKLTGPDGHIFASFESDPKGKLPISESNLRIIKRALVGAVNDEKATGNKCKLPDVLVAGKTGTAQVIGQAKRRQDKKLDWKYRDHAWFVAYAPADKPELAVAVLCEHAGHGGSVAAPIARKVFEKWFQIQSPLPVLRPCKTAFNIKSIDNHV